MKKYVIINANEVSSIDFNTQSGSIEYVQATVTFKYTLFEFS